MCFQVSITTYHLLNLKNNGSSYCCKNSPRKTEEQGEVRMVQKVMLGEIKGLEEQSFRHQKIVRKKQKNVLSDEHNSERNE